MDIYADYKIALAGVCYYCARLAILNEKKENGEIISPEEVELLCNKISAGKDALLKEKEALGFTDGLSFMEDNRFAGFWIENGFIYGNTEKIFLIVRPMYEGFPDNRNNYQYEVANYLLAFMQQTEEETVCPSIKDIVFRKITDVVATLKNWHPLRRRCYGS